MADTLPIQHRTSRVQNLHVNEVGFSSTLFVGDLVRFDPRSSALAVQREIPRYDGREGELSQYPIFSVDIPELLPAEQVELVIQHRDSSIMCSTVKVDSISTASMVQIGRLGSARAVSRVKNIREKLTGLQTL
ncbi:spore germination protein GerPE [Paenibacillus sp. YYML68]|uniref:spore germination protein GerPE n=1 Tax=Paenibacillus sp. YYML68 TaxID=2909250 RepID=UPI002490A7A5|nr:spore germination protein GerPE [Paenibacillus sp. YYML68]